MLSFLQIPGGVLGERAHRREKLSAAFFFRGHEYVLPAPAKKKRLLPNQLHKLHAFREGHGRKNPAPDQFFLSVSGLAGSVRNHRLEGECLMNEFLLFLGGLVLLPFAFLFLILLMEVLPQIIVYFLTLAVWLIAFIVAAIVHLWPVWICFGFIFCLWSFK